MASMLTTEDNPYDPRVDFQAWYAWDVANGYNTCSYLARATTLPDGFPQIYVDYINEQAMDELIALHDGKLYKKLPIDDAA